VVPSNPMTRALQLKEWRDNIVRLFKDPKAAIERSVDSLTIVNYSDHEKYWITGRIDGGKVELTAIMGGMNLASEYAYGGTTRKDAVTKRGGWRDVDVELRGPVVTDIIRRFFDVMDHHTGKPTDPKVRIRWIVAQPEAGKAKVRFVWNHPAEKQRRAIEKLYATLIDATPRGGVVRIENAYFAPSRTVRLAIKRALARRTRLAVVTNSPETSDIGVLVDASRYAYYALLETNAVVALFERRPRPDIGEHTLHSKVASFGTCGPFIIGSANLDAQSAEHNSESVVLIDDDRLRKSFDAMYEEDIGADRTQRITMQLYRDQSVLQWIKQTWAFVLSDYWL
jgi:phosphatidylserine/phosphatidylglycerophosphate/cardiolipin synthase-like enzyme